MSEWDEFYEHLGRMRFPFFGMPSFRELFREFEHFERYSDEIFKDLGAHAPKELVRERRLPGGGVSREYGPFVYGCSVTVGPNGKPRIRQFGNVRPGRGRLPMEVAETREPLVDVIDEGETVKILAEMPGLERKDIRLEAAEKGLTISSETPRKYYKEIELDIEIQPNKTEAKYNNGVLEVRVAKAKPVKPRGTGVKVE